MRIDEFGKKVFLLIKQKMLIKTILKVLNNRIVKVLKVLNNRIESRRIRRLANKYLSYYLDDLSRSLIEVKLITWETWNFTNILSKYIELGYDKWNIPELERYDESKVFYVSGNGDCYEYCILLLKHSKYSDRTKIIGQDISIFENAKCDSVLIAIAENGNDQQELTNELKDRFPNRIIHPLPYKKLIGTFGWQYFDVFSPKEEEVFINAGAFQGETDIDFVKWTNNAYKKIYMFEPIKDNVDICRKVYEENNIERVEIFCKGTWSYTGVLHFTQGENSQGAITESGDARIDVISIDDAVKRVGDRGGVTFLKMDIEGAELRALQGARETILRGKPRMAICIYHKRTDLYEIPQYLLSLVPEYRFKVRQYASNNWETVLYAAIEGDW